MSASDPSSSSKAGPTPEVPAESPAVMQEPRIHWQPLGFSNPHHCLSIFVEVREWQISLMINTSQPHPHRGPCCTHSWFVRFFLHCDLKTLSIFSPWKPSSLIGKLLPKYFSIISNLCRERVTTESICCCFLLKQQVYVDVIIFSLNTPPQYNSCRKTVIWANLILVGGGAGPSQEFWNWAVF